MLGGAGADRPPAACLSCLRSSEEERIPKMNTCLLFRLDVGPQSHGRRIASSACVQNVVFAAKR